MDFLLWIVFSIITALTGVFLVQYLVTSPQRMGFFLILILVLLAGSIVWAVIIFDTQQSLAVIIFGLTCFIVGYLGATTRFLKQQENRPLPAINRSPGESGLGHTAVIYFTHGEPPAYDPFPWLETIRELDHDHVPFIPFAFRPFFFHAIRKEYSASRGQPS